MNFKSWQTWVMLGAVVLVAALNWIFPSLNLATPENTTVGALILWLAVTAAKVIGLLAVGGVTYGVVKREYALRMAAIPKRASLPRAGDTASEISELMQWIYQDLVDNAIPYKKVDANGVVTIDPVPVAPRVSMLLSRRWNDPGYSMAFKLTLLTTALTICSDAFKKITNLPVPTAWREVDDSEEYWFNNQPSCAVSSEALFHQAIMPLRTVLKIKDTGDI